MNTDGNTSHPPRASSHGNAHERGMLLYRQSRYALAADEFRKALSTNPNSASSLSMLALCLVYDRHPDDALAAAKAAIAANPQSAFSHYALSNVIIGHSTPWSDSRLDRLRRHFNVKFSYRPRLRAAIPPLMEAIRINPLSAEYLSLMSAIKLDLRRPTECLEWAEKALAAQPDHVRSNNLRARALAKLGRTREAFEAHQNALALDPDSASTHSHGGWTHLQVGNPEKAVKHFEESVRLNPNDANAHVGLRAARLKTKAAFSGAGIGVVILVRVISYFTQNPSSNDPAAVIGIAIACILAAVLFFLLRYHKKKKP